MADFWRRPVQLWLQMPENLYMYRLMVVREKRQYMYVIRVDMPRTVDRESTTIYANKSDLIVPTPARWAHSALLPSHCPHTRSQSAHHHSIVLSAVMCMCMCFASPRPLLFRWHRPTLAS